jgi:penicillin-binding protein 2
MPPPSLEDRRPPITPQLAMRVALLGGFAFVLFAIVFFRLWFLQVLSGETYVSQARENRVRKVRIEAPRGDIVDRNNRKLVTTRVAPVVQIVPDSLPPEILRQADDFRKARAGAEAARLAAADRLRSLERDMREAGPRAVTAEQRRDRRRLTRESRAAPPVDVPPPPVEAHDIRGLYRTLGRVIGMRPQSIHERVVAGVADTPYSNVTIKTLASDRAAFNYLVEHKEQFPGVVVEKRYLREYPFRTLAAQLFGTVNEISPAQLELKRFRRVDPGTRIGQTGLEARYDRYLRGTDGYTRVVVNSSGNREAQARTTRVDPRQGQRVRLTLDLGLQRAADTAMARAIGWASGNGARAGAYVAMDPTTGEVLALGSYPSFDANVLARPISQRTYDALTSEAQGAPLLNRAIASQYPTGSTFKPVTAMAALEEGIIRPEQIINDTGEFKLGPQTFKNARDAVFGPLNIVDALKVSSDVFFYELGNRANGRGPVIQEWARAMGLGHPTGIDLPGEFKGLIPDAKWRNAGYKKYLRCAKKAKVTPGTAAALFACGGIEREWSAGDNVNLSVGQGDLQATPLQLATVYSTLVNGGTVVRPHLGAAIQDGNGRLVEELRIPNRGKVKFSAASRETIMSGLRAAAMEPRGTSADIFSGYRWPVYGKTGTAERAPAPDQSWYAVYVDHPTKPIVVVTTIERGGFGAETAAPAACLILNKWLHESRECLPGSNQSR